MFKFFRGAKKKDKTTKHFDRFSSRNKTICTYREPPTDIVRCEPKRQSTSRAEGNIQRHDVTRHSMDNHRATLTINLHLVDENRKLRIGCEHARRNEEYYREQLNTVEEQHAKCSNQPGAGDTDRVSVDVHTENRLRSAEEENEKLRSQIMEANQQNGVIRTQLLQQIKQTSALESVATETHAMIKGMKGESGDTLQVCRGIEKTMASNQADIVKLLDNMDDTTKEALTKLDKLGRLQTALPVYNCANYDSLGAEVKETMAMLEHFIGPRWPKLILALGLPPDMIQFLRDSKLSQCEIYWRIMHKWYSEGSVSLEELERCCLSMNIKLFTDQPMSMLHREAISRQTVDLTDDGDPLLIVPHIKQRMVFPAGLSDYVFSTEVRFECMVRLLDSIQVMGDKAFHVFVRALLFSGFDFLATKLQEEEARLVSEEAKALSDASKHFDRPARRQPRYEFPEPESQLEFESYSADTVTRKPRAVVDRVNPYPVEFIREFADFKATMKHCEAMMMTIAYKQSIKDIETTL